MNRYHRLVSGWLLTLGLLQATASAQTSDVVHQTSGRQIRGEITAISPTQVSVQVRDALQQVAANEIRRISFAQEPARAAPGPRPDP